jgi:hypothetical protein
MLNIQLFFLESVSDQLFNLILILGEDWPKVRRELLKLAKDQMTPSQLAEGILKETLTSPAASLVRQLMREATAKAGSSKKPLRRGGGGTTGTPAASANVQELATLAATNLMVKLESVPDRVGEYRPSPASALPPPAPLEVARAEKPNAQPPGGTTQEAPSIVYPNITPSSEHAVQNSTIDIDVSLDFEKRGRTVGSAQLPEDEAEHVIEVHLLFGTVSLRGSLKFQRPHGTTKAAKFERVPVPVIGRNERNEVPESVLSDITANFYLNNRWCGEALLTIEILARKNSEALAAIQQKQVMPWREYLCVSPDAAPPDLMVRIQLSGGQFKWSLLSPHMSFSDLSAADMDSPVADLPFRFVKTNFEVFTGAPLTDEQLEDLDTKCDLIYAATATGFKKAYWRLFRASRQAGSKVKLESIQFVSDEPYIPWELMRVWDKDSPELPEILGVRHAVGRWMAGDSCELRQELQIKKIAVCATSYKDIPDVQQLPWAEEERKYLQDHFSAFDVKMLRAEVKTFLETGIAEVVHFSCHGDMSAQQPEDSSLDLEDKKIKPGLVGRPETRLGIGKSKPLVFLNACQVGGAGKVLGLVFGWPQAFLNIGSTACIAPLWSVIDENARDIAEDFYQMTLIDSPPKSLGQALQSIRQQWRAKRSLTYLGYVLYGDPTARITR